MFSMVCAKDVWLRIRSSMRVAWPSLLRFVRTLIMVCRGREGRRREQNTRFLVEYPIRYRSAKTADKIHQRSNEERSAALAYRHVSVRLLLLPLVQILGLRHANDRRVRLLDAPLDRRPSFGLLRLHLHGAQQAAHAGARAEQVRDLVAQRLQGQGWMSTFSRRGDMYEDQASDKQTNHKIGYKYIERCSRIIYFECINTAWRRTTQSKASAAMYPSRSWWSSFRNRAPRAVTR